MSHTGRRPAGSRVRADVKRAAIGIAFALAFATSVLLVRPGQEAAASHLPAIWIGSPVNGTWGVPGNWSTVPPKHHRLYKVLPTSDWTVDLSSIPSSDRAVYTYAAPQNSTYNSRVSARILQIVDDNACRYGGGGDFVTVGFYFDSTLIGRATYAHLDRDPSLYVGKWIPRWGGYLGQVAILGGAATGGSDCWTGPHVHFEMRSEKHYACWNRGYTSPGYGIRRTNFLGFIGGALSTTSATPCP